MSIFLFLSILLVGVEYIHCERLKNQIYSSISGSNACFRRLNGTHQAGCSSPRNGAHGVVQMISSIEDAKWIVMEAEAGPYIAVVNTLLFNDIIETFMENPENVAGVLVYDKKEGVNRAKSFSLESQCPNEYYSDSQSQCTSGKPGSSWNPKGSGLLRRDIPFSIIFSPAEHNDDIDKIEECYQRYNKDRSNQRGSPLCSIEMNTFMYAAVSTELCMRRSHDTSFFTATKLCDPIGDYNIYYPLFPRVKNNSSNENITLVTARIDAASLFDNISPGAASSVVGAVALVTTAAFLSKILPAADREKYDNNILFTLFNGEAFDYIGSQSVAFDLNRTAWPRHNPLSPENIKLHVEVGQIGGYLQNQDTQTPNPKWPMYAFTPNELTNPEIIQFTNDISTYYGLYSESLIPKSTNNTPPSSLHSFRRILKHYTDTTLPEILIVDHEDTFTNMYYNSALDEYYQLGFDYRNITIGTDGTFKTTEELISSGIMKETDMQVKISRLVTALARTLYKRVSGDDYNGVLTASAHLVDEILFCLTRSQACALMQASTFGHSSDDAWPNTPPLMYASVTHYASNPALYLGYMLALLTGTEVPASNRSQCKNYVAPVVDILYCLTRSQACALMQASTFGHSSDDAWPNTPPLMYASVTHYASNPALYLGYMLALLTGTEVPTSNRSQCKNYVAPVVDILYCLTRSQACALMQASTFGHSSDDAWPNTPPLMYASVTHYASNPALYLGYMLALLTGTEVPTSNRSQCKNYVAPDCGDCAYYWMKGWSHTGVCLQTSMNMSLALSPAFLIEDYDMKSGLYSTWTESVWQGMTARLFVRAGGAGATTAAVSGFAATALATFLTFWLKKHNSVVFANTGTLTATDEATSGILRTVNC